MGIVYLNENLGKMLGSKVRMVRRRKNRKYVFCIRLEKDFGKLFRFLRLNRTLGARYIFIDDNMMLAHFTISQG